MSDLLEEAIAWRIRLAGADETDWERFVEWLAISPAHGETYDLVALAEGDATDRLTQVEALPQPANDHPGGWIRGRGWLLSGGAIAASLVLGFGLLQVRPQRYEVRTGPGERREVAIGGTEILLNGDSWIELDRKDARYASLIAGEARFTVMHDAARPFRLKVGDNVAEDVGTVFDVTRDRTGVRVEVAEGAVLYNPDRERVVLSAGKTLFDPTGGAPIRVGARAPEAIGGWSRARLSYNGEALDRIAADLSRATGIGIRVAPDIASRAFSGIIWIDANGEASISMAAALLGVGAQRTKEGWLLTARP